MDIEKGISPKQLPLLPASNQLTAHIILKFEASASLIRRRFKFGSR